MAPPDSEAVSAAIATAATATPPTIISDGLRKELARVSGQVPAGRSGQATIGVSQSGVEVGAAWRPASHLTFSGYASRLWGTGGWIGAAQGTLTW